MMDDPDYAERVAEASLYRDDDGEEPPSWSPAYKDYTALYQLMTQVHDAIERVSYTVAATSGNGARPKKPRAFPTPETAIQRAQRVAERDMANDLLSKFGLGPLGAGPKIAPQPRQSVHRDDEASEESGPDS